MIKRLQLLRNVGLFDSVDEGANIALAPLTLIYAENGRGKSTLAAVLRSLATGDPIPIGERRRLSAAHPPHVVLDCDGGAAPAMFQNNAWNRTVPNMAVFDDVFVDQNVYSGLAVGAEHRQKLHELILGAQGVVLTRQLQQIIERIEGHNSELRIKGAAIPERLRGGLSVEEFCGLTARADIDEALQDTERQLAAAHEQDPVRQTRLFETLHLPTFDIPAVERILQEDLPALDAAAASRVQAHVGGLGRGGETWIDDGMRRIPPAAPGAATPCPFCAQDLAGSDVIRHYRAYFSAEYAALKGRVSELLEGINRTHGGDGPATFERMVRVAVERRGFWSRFCDVPEVSVDTARIVRDWSAAREAVAGAVRAKQAGPLERMALAPEAHTAVAAYEAHRESIARLSAALQGANARIQVVKEQAAGANPATIDADLSRLNAVKVRQEPAIAARCREYLIELAAKTRADIQRDEARTALDLYKTNVFPGYQIAVNVYLLRFNAGFRIDSIMSANTRGGPACSYNVVINNTPVPIGATLAPGQPSFRNTLSAGDRNTLALAFFFASVDQDAGLGGKVVVIDDPISSLDEHRSLTTVQEMRRLGDRTEQLIVLSHSKPFLCSLWEGADSDGRAAVEVGRGGAGSTLREWDVNQDSITEHDRRHAMLREYLNTARPNNREVARAIRPVLEAFVRVAYPEHFPPGAKLGQFRDVSRQRVDTAWQILNGRDVEELGDVLEYANRFHHDTNLAFETVNINDAELRGFVERALAFAKR
jgi:wobble nucleotide-excising tRNase